MTPAGLDPVVVADATGRRQPARYRARALTYAVAREADGRPRLDRPITSSRDVAALARTALVGEHDDDRERFWILVLDGRGRYRGHHLVSVGTVSRSLVHMSEVYRAALLFGAAAIVAVHNHPSGDPRPSDDDTDTTRRLTLAGDLLGITVLDHVIVGNGSGAYYSFADAQTEGLAVGRPPARGSRRARTRRENSA